MRLATFETQGRQGIGVVLPDSQTLVDVTPLLGERADGPGGLAEFIGEWDSVKTALTPLPAELFRFKVADVTLQAPLPRPARNLICVGRNYFEHAKEFAASGYDSSVQTREAARADAPVFFTKATTTVTGPFSDVGLHADVTSEVDYEGELALIVGRAGRNIDKGNALDHVWGYTIVNDVTARDLQKTHKQWFLGKSLDLFCPMGPWVVDLRHPDPHRGALRRHDPQRRRRHLHRNPRGGRHRLQSAEVPQPPATPSKSRSTRSAPSATASTSQSPSRTEEG